MLNRFNFDPPTGLRDKAIYQTNPATEDAAREQIQRGMDQLKGYANDTLAKEIDTLSKQMETLTKNVDEKQTKNTVLKEKNGWTKDNDTGIIKQWGIRSIPATPGNGTFGDTFDLNIPFPNEMFNIHFTLVCKSEADANGVTLSGCASDAITLSKIAYRWKQTGQIPVGNCSVYWSAIGH